MSGMWKINLSVWVISATLLGSVPSYAESKEFVTFHHEDLVKALKSKRGRATKKNANFRRSEATIDYNYLSSLGVYKDKNGVIRKKPNPMAAENPAFDPEFPSLTLNADGIVTAQVRVDRAGISSFTYDRQLPDGTTFSVTYNFPNGWMDSSANRMVIYGDLKTRLESQGYEVKPNGEIWKDGKFTGLNLNQIINDLVQRYQSQSGYTGGSSAPGSSSSSTYSPGNSSGGSGGSSSVTYGPGSGSSGVPGGSSSVSYGPGNGSSGGSYSGSLGDKPLYPGGNRNGGSSSSYGYQVDPNAPGGSSGHSSYRDGGPGGDMNDPSYSEFRRRFENDPDFRRRVLSDMNRDGNGGPGGSSSSSSRYNSGGGQGEDPIDALYRRYGRTRPNRVAVEISRDASGSSSQDDYDIDFSKMPSDIDSMVQYLKDKGITGSDDEIRRLAQYALDYKNGDKSARQKFVSMLKDMKDTDGKPYGNRSYRIFSEVFPRSSSSSSGSPSRSGYRSHSSSRPGTSGVEDNDSNHGGFDIEETTILGEKQLRVGVIGSDGRTEYKYFKIEGNDAKDDSGKVVFRKTKDGWTLVDQSLLPKLVRTRSSTSAEEIMNRVADATGGRIMELKLELGKPGSKNMKTIAPETPIELGPKSGEAVQQLIDVSDFYKK